MSLRQSLFPPHVENAFGGHDASDIELAVRVWRDFTGSAEEPTQLERRLQIRRAILFSFDHLGNDVQRRLCEMMEKHAKLMAAEIEPKSSWFEIVMEKLGRFSRCLINSGVAPR